MNRLQRRERPYYLSRITCSVDDYGSSFKVRTAHHKASAGRTNPRPNTHLFAPHCALRWRGRSESSNGNDGPVVAGRS